MPETWDNSMCPEMVVKMPTGNHNDWWKPFRWIPRSWFAVEGTPPKRTFGNATLGCVTSKGKQYIYPKPIPGRGQWYFCIKGLAWSWQTSSGKMIRIAIARWDDIDNYFELLSFAYRNYGK